MKNSLPQKRADLSPTLLQAIRPAEATLDIAHALESAGVDLLELGIPFSDPLADGPTIQAASNRALVAGMTVARSLEIVERFRTKSELPIVLFTYLNPIYAFGFEKFLTNAAGAGADGLLILDLPPDEAEHDTGLIWSGGLDPIRSGCAHHSSERMAKIVSTAQGFVYYVSREGVTGEQSRLADTISAQVAELRRHTTLPIAVGFGISTPSRLRWSQPSGCGRCWERHRPADLGKRHSS